MGGFIFLAICAFGTIIAAVSYIKDGVRPTGELGAAVCGGWLFLFGPAISFSAFFVEDWLFGQGYGLFGAIAAFLIYVFGMRILCTPPDSAHDSQKGYCAPPATYTRTTVSQPADYSTELSPVDATGGLEDVQAATAKDYSVLAITVVCVVLLFLIWVAWLNSDSRPNPVPPVERTSTTVSRPFQIQFQNKCEHKVELAIGYVSVHGQFTALKGWEFGNGVPAFLSDDSGNRLESKDRTVWIHAKSTDGSNLAWQGERKVVINGALFLMQPVALSASDPTIRLDCQ